MMLYKLFRNTFVHLYSQYAFRKPFLDIYNWLMDFQPEELSKSIVFDDQIQYK